jgi:hypothetical protein
MADPAVTDHVVSFDPDYLIRSLPPGFGTPRFREADADAAAFLRFWRASFLTCSELTTRASKLSPHALRIVRWAVTELEFARERIDRKRANHDGEKE